MVAAVGGSKKILLFSTQLQFWLFCCWRCGCCWAVPFALMSSILELNALKFYDEIPFQIGGVLGLKKSQALRDLRTLNFLSVFFFDKIQPHFRALKFSKSKNFRVLKFSKCGNFRDLKFSYLAVLE